MKLSRRTALTSLSLAAVLVAGVFLINSRAAQQDEEAGTTSSESRVTQAVAETAADSSSDDTVEPASTASAEESTAKPIDFTVPDGTVAEKLAFLDRLTQPTTQFTSAAQANEYWRKAAVAMKTGADQILKEKASDSQASEAVQFKVEALRIHAMLGNKDTEKERTEFLDACLKDPRFEVSSVVGPLRLIPKFRRWQSLDATQRTAAIDQYISDVKAAGPTPGQGQLLIGFGDELSDTPDRKVAARAIDELLPKFRNSKDEIIATMVPVLEGLSRRLNLPGNKLELEGDLITGQPFDWEAYRGKVVLVDFWASWCPECIKEVPNMLENYREYHDKGFEIVGICLDNERAVAERFIRQTGMTWPQIFSEKPYTEEWTHQLAEKYAITGIPRAILVDQEGKVVSMMARGPLLHANLEKLLGPSNAGNPPESARTGRAQPPADAASKN